MWRSLFWRSALALMSMLVLTATFAASVLADSHPAPSGGGGDQGGGQAAAQGATQTVTAVPNTGVGTSADSSATALLLGLVAIAALMAVASLATSRRQRA